MPACRQCGRENAEGMVFCGYCATPLARPAGNPVSSAETKPIGNPASSPPIRGASPETKPIRNPVSSPPIRAASPQPQPFKLEIRPPVIHTPSSAPPSDGDKDKGKGKGGFELIPWSELSPVQRAGRSAAAAIALFVVFFLVRGMVRALLSSSKPSGNAPSAQTSGAPITESDRRDGIESLCGVFQIYGLPKNDHDGAEAVRNAAELFKLAGNQSPERSAYILTTIVGEFRSGKLSPDDCAQAGKPIATTEQNTTPDANQ